METTKVTIDGKEIEIVTKIDKEEIEENIIEENIENTLDLSELLDQTAEINIGDNNGY